MRSLDYHSPSGTRSTLVNDNVIKLTKSEVSVHAESFVCVGKVKRVGKLEQEPSAADADWTGQIEDLIKYPSYQDAVGVDGEAVEVEWKIFTGLTTPTIVKEIQMDLERENTEPENFKDWIIFM